MCVPCPRGYYTQDRVQCLPCAPGTYADKQGSTACAPCAANTFARFNGSILCGACEVETFSGEGETRCHDCYGNLLQQRWLSMRPRANTAVGYYVSPLLLAITVLLGTCGLSGLCWHWRLARLHRTAQKKEMLGIMVEQVTHAATHGPSYELVDEMPEYIQAAREAGGDVELVDQLVYIHEEHEKEKARIEEEERQQREQDEWEEEERLAEEEERREHELNADIVHEHEHELHEMQARGVAKAYLEAVLSADRCACQKSPVKEPYDTQKRPVDM
jgi:hypothetical protein